MAARLKDMEGATPANERRGPRDGGLERAIGHQIRFFRKRLGVTATELARQARLSPGMLSKIENGQTSPSLGTLQALSAALNVPVTALFRTYEEQRDATHVRAGGGLKIERRGSRSGHRYWLLGSTFGQTTTLEPYLVELDENAEVFPLFQHQGLEFLYMLEGEMAYRHGTATYTLKPGDSLFFESDATHGPEALIKTPVRMLTIMCHARTSGEA